MLTAITAFSGVSVNDQAKAKDFYAQTLGLELMNEEMGLHFKLPGGGELFIYDKGEGHTPADYTMLNFVVEEIDKTVDELTAQGVNFEHYENMSMPLDEKGILRGLKANQGPDIAWFKDPAGNVLSVIQPK